MKKQQSPIFRFILDCGGSTYVAAWCGVHAQAVEQWYLNGIPERHWPKLIKKFGATLEGLFEMNQKIRAAKNEQ